jgi:large subunit ribosomal protein L18
MNKQIARLRRAKKTAMIIRLSARPRLIVHRSNVHIYAQIISYGSTGDTVLVCASSLDGDIKKNNASAKKSEKAHAVGMLVAQRAIERGIKQVAFDRRGYKYHGRVKAMAAGAREAGLEF